MNTLLEVSIAFGFLQFSILFVWNGHSMHFLSLISNFNLYFAVNPNSLMQTEDYNGNRLPFSMGMMSRNFMDQQMMKSEFGAMDLTPTGTFSFVESLGSDAGVSLPHYTSNQSLLSSTQMANNADVW